MDRWDRHCDDCHVKDGTVKLRQNDWALCWSCYSRAVLIENKGSIEEDTNGFDAMTAITAMIDVYVCWCLNMAWMMSCLSVLGQNPPGHKPPDKNPLDKNPPCQKPPGQKPPRQNILFRNFITFVFRMSYGKEISIWFLAVKYVRHGSIK